MALTNLEFLSVDRQWPPPEEAPRLEGYLANQRLFESRHELVFNQWFRLLRADQQATLEIVIDLPKRLSTLWADLIAGEAPRFVVGERGGAAQERLKEMLKRLRYVTILKEGIIDISRYGDAVFKASLRRGKAAVSVQPPHYWFPVVTIGDVREVRYHVLAFTYERMERSPLLRREQKVTYLKAEIHGRGTIEHRLYSLENGRIRTEVSDSAQMREDFPDLPGEMRDGRKVEETGIDDFLVQHAPGLRASGRLFGMDDYGGILGLLQEMEVRLAQISRILDEHADPNMYGPASALTTDPLTGEVSYAAGGNFFPMDENGTPPGYLVWDGQLGAAFKELDLLLSYFYFASETSPAAFGQMDVGVATSGTALRRLMMVPLKKAARMTDNLDPVAVRLLELCAGLEDRSAESGASIEGLTIEWNDGLPDDETEETANETAQVEAGLSSRFSSIKRLHNLDDDGAKAEMERINEESEGQEPSPLDRLLNGAPLRTQ